MAGIKRRIDLNCAICHFPLTSTQTALSEEVLSILAEQNVVRKNIPDAEEYKRNASIHKDQVVATKCGHMFHMGCLRNHFKNGIDKKGAVFCPICTRPVSLQRIWPVLIPPTPLQALKIKKLTEMKEQNTTMREDLNEIRKRMNEKQFELKQIQDATSQCLEDIQEKQKQLDSMEGPSDQELEELRKIQKKRQAIVRVVTKHNSELLELLMHETNVEVSQTDVRDLDRIYKENREKHNSTRDKNNNKYKNQPHPIQKINPEIHHVPLNINAYSEIMSQPDCERTPVTNFGSQMESFQEINAASSDTFSSDKSCEDLNNNDKKRIIPLWKPKPKPIAVRDRNRGPRIQPRVSKAVVFDYGYGEGRNNNDSSNHNLTPNRSLARLTNTNDSINVSLPRRGGTRDIVPHRNNIRNKGAISLKNKKLLSPVALPSWKPKWQ